MTKLNKKGTDPRLDFSMRVAGGFGAYAAQQGPEALLRRLVMACLLWENNAYESGSKVAKEIAKLIPKVEASTVAKIAIEAREQQKLRHIPLFIAVEMTKYPEHKKFVREVLNRVITRADQLVDVLAIHWNKGRRSVPLQMKRGLADGFAKFNEYQFAKYDRAGQIKLRDVLRICHAKPPQGKEGLFRSINQRTLPVPDTWEVALSRGNDKKETWTRLIESQKLGSLAFLRNLRNMKQSGVPKSVIKTGFQNLNQAGLLPLNFLAAYVNAPQFKAEIEAAMFRCYSQREKLPGLTVFVMDVSGSMGAPYSEKSTQSRVAAGSAMAVLAREQCERSIIYATAGSDRKRVHATKRLPDQRGFALCRSIEDAQRELGGGGIFTRQCLAHIAVDLKKESIDRVVVFSDSQDCDSSKALPKMIGKSNYIIDVSSNTRGINYRGLWTAEISGWSEHFLDFIAATEGLQIEESE